MVGSALDFFVMKSLNRQRGKLAFLGSVANARVAGVDVALSLLNATASAMLGDVIVLTILM